MSFLADLRMLLEQGALEVTTKANNRTAVKSIIFADGDVISLADPELVTAAIARDHVNSVNSTISNAMLGAGGLARCINYAAGVLGISVFIYNFSVESFVSNNLQLALLCAVGSALGQVGFGLLGSRLFSRVL